MRGSDQDMKITFLGTGIMGAPMARHLAQAGHEVTVWNRTAEQGGGRWPSTARAWPTTPRRPSAARRSW